MRTQCLPRSMPQPAVSLSWVTLCLVSLSVLVGSAQAAPPASLVEIKVGKTTHTGRVLANQGETVYLQGRDGAISQIEIGNVGQFRQISAKFEPWSATMLASQVRKELGTGYVTSTTRHFIVCGSDEQKTRAYVNLFEDTYRSFRVYFSVRGFKLPEPECPLVAIVFPDHETFGKYAARDKVRASKGLRGYYHALSNRVALFEDDKNLTWRTPVDRAPPEPFGRANLPDLMLRLDAPGGIHPQPFADLGWAGSIDGDLQSTMIHEATHQVAFNLGLHARVGSNPRWVVEGLATVFEAPGIRNSQANNGVKSRLNLERHGWFVSYAKNRRKARTLTQFLSDDKQFDANTLDAYSEAWALSFYLIEKRPRDYAEYLARMAQKDPLKEYTAQQRLADFQQTISKDINLIEAECLRFINGIK